MIVEGANLFFSDRARGGWIDLMFVLYSLTFAGSLKKAGGPYSIYITVCTGFQRILAVLDFFSTSGM